MGSKRQNLKRRRKARLRKEESLKRLRQRLEARLRPIIAASPDGFAVPDWKPPEYAPWMSGLMLTNMPASDTRCYPEGFRIRSKGGKYVIRPWKDLNWRECSLVDSYKWTTSQTKHPLEYLAECADK